MERKRDLDRSWGALRNRLETSLPSMVREFNAEVVRLGLEGIVTGGRAGDESGLDGRFR